MFCVNCATCRCIFNVSVGEGELPVLLLRHLDPVSQNLSGRFEFQLRYRFWCFYFVILSCYLNLMRCYWMFVDDVPVSPLCKRLLSSPGCPSWPRWGWGLLPLAQYSQGLWEHLLGLRSGTQEPGMLVCGSTGRFVGGSEFIKELVHLCRVLRSGTRCLGRSYWSINFLATFHQGLDPWYIPLGKGRKSHSRVKWWHRDPTPPPYYPFHGAVGAISLVWVRTHSPGMTHRLSGHR